MEIRRIQSLKEGVDVSGIRARVKVVKNKVAPPFRTAEFDIMFNEGISKAGNLLDLGVEFNVVKKSGSWYEYEDEKLGQGRESAKLTIKENPKLLAEIEKKIRSVAANKNNLPLRLGGDENNTTEEPENAAELEE